MIHSFRIPTTLALLTWGVSNLTLLSSCQAQTGTLPTDVRPLNPLQTNVPRPNVLLILADDLGWSDLGCFGSEIQTPHLDALAKGGLSFTQFYNSARCSPTRASLLTGLTPHQAGVANIGPPISRHAVTLPEVLGAAGYSTSMVGKWHLTERITPVDRGFQEFYGMLGGYNSFWKEDPWYTRLPAGHAKRTYKRGEFYSTDAFADYAVDFIDQSQKTGKPWFQYLAFNAPHFPLHAPEKDVARYEKVYAQGWDKIREQRLAQQKKLGLVPRNVDLTPRSVVPKNGPNTQTGWADKANPAWDSLPADRRADLARRMAVYAAMIDRMDQAVGRVVTHLKETKQIDNTLILFLSDNGACAEWDPFGFDVDSGPNNILHTGADLKNVGGPDSYISYGSGWANASNTPWRMYKHYAQEGGIRTPLLVHWPQGLKTKAGSRTDQPGWTGDVMPTLLQLCGATYPKERNGQTILPYAGDSLVPILNGSTIPPRLLYMEHEGNRMVRDSNWKLAALSGKPWELYNLATDPTEMRDLSAGEAARVTKMSAAWDAWNQKNAERPQGSAMPTSNPQLVNKALTISCDVTAQSRTGVILAQGGDQRGYVLLLQDGKPIFSVRQNGTLFSAAATEAPTGKFSLEAHLEKDGTMTLAVNGTIVARGKAPGVFVQQPVDELSIGEDIQSAVGNYKAPYTLIGKIENVKVVAN